MFEPLVKAHQRSRSDASSMGWLYGDLAMKRAEIGMNVNLKEKNCFPIWFSSTNMVLIDNRWDDKLLLMRLFNLFFYYQKERTLKQWSLLDALLNACIRCSEWL